jgi:hypothetical protein
MNTAESAKPMHKIEAYIDVPEQLICDGYGFPTGKIVPSFSSCNRRGYEANDIDEALAQALVEALQQWDEPTKQAEKFTVCVQSKYGPPQWKVEIDRSY